MKALQFMSPNVMSVNEIAIPKIADDEVLLASRSVGICHSDIELLEGRYTFLSITQSFLDMNGQLK